MPFQLSPGVNVSEIDLTTVVPAVSTTQAAIAGVYRWGPVNQPILVDSESLLVSRFGKPTNHNAETWFTGANFLSYGNQLYVVRAANTVGYSYTNTATSNTTANSVVILDNTAPITAGSLVYGNTVPSGTVVVSKSANTTATLVVLSKTPTVDNQSFSVLFSDANTTFSAIANVGQISDSLSTFSVNNRTDFDHTTFPIDGTVPFIARYPGAYGDSLKVSVCDSPTAYSSSLTGITATFAVGSSNVVLQCGSGPNATNVNSQLTVGDYIAAGNTTVGIQYLQVVSSATNGSNVTIAFGESYKLAQNVTVTSGSIVRYWEFFGNVNGAPRTTQYQANFGSDTSVEDEIHVVVSDEDGGITGVPGTVIEVFQGLSRNTQAKTQDGAVNYYKTVINDNSGFIYNTEDIIGSLSGTNISVISSTNLKPSTLSFNYGSDGLDEASVPVNTILFGYDKFRSAEDITISLVLAGKARGGSAKTETQVAQYITDNIAEQRKDCLAFISPSKATVVNNVGNELDDLVAYRNAYGRSTSYAVMDTGYKYQYDKYNDIYRYVPLNGDIAGLCVRTDNVRDAWWSPAGFNRGQILNVVKLAYNPGKADRDNLYVAGINPVVTFPGQGTILYGDKTLLSKPSAFDRINVRRLFIVLEKAIATASKYTLFEFNDEFTRAQFVSLVTPFLRDVQGRRGIYDFRVVCDASNNTGERIDRNEFWGDIYIKPAKSINFIQLNFVAVRTGVEFSEVVGKF